MPYRPQQAALRQLHNTAHLQGGYVTAKQAAQAGFGHTHLEYHARVGNLERVERGLYRVPTIPVSDHDDLIRLSLWSRDRLDRPQAIFSHVTALVFYGITNLLPSKLYATVPKRFYRKPPRGCVLYRRALRESDFTRDPGFAVTTVLRTLIDVADAPEVSVDELEYSVAEAIERGLVSKREIVEAAGAEGVAGDLRRVLDERSRRTR